MRSRPRLLDNGAGLQSKTGRFGFQNGTFRIAKRHISKAETTHSVTI